MIRILLVLILTCAVSVEAREVWTVEHKGKEQIGHIQTEHQNELSRECFIETF